MSSGFASANDIALVVVGVAVDRPLLIRPARRRVFGPLLWIDLTQIAFTAAHWTLLDVRESEYRLATGRYFW